MDAPKEEGTPLEEKKSESEGHGTKSEGQRRESEGQGTKSDGQRRESEGQGTESEGQRRESGHGTESEGQGTESEGQRRESGQGTESEGQRRESEGQGTESEGQRRESRQGTKSEGQRRESEGQGTESGEQRRESEGQGRESEGQGRESEGQGQESEGQGRESEGQGRESEGQGRELGQGTDLEGQGTESEGQGRELGQGTESEGQGTESEGQWRKSEGQGTESETQWRESEGQGTESERQWRESEGQGTESERQWRKSEGQGTESERQWRKSEGQGTESEGQWRKSEGQGTESDGQRDSRQGTESDRASDKRSGVECKERLTIFTRDQDFVVAQLLRLFSSNPAFKCGSVCRIFQVEDDKWKSEVDGSSVIVLHLSHSPEAPLPDLSDVKEFLDYCREKHDLKNIKVVISDVEDVNLERMITDWWNAGRYRDLELLTISKTEMRFLIEHKINPLSVERRMANKLRHIYQILQEATEKKHQRALQKYAGNWISRFAEHLLLYPWSAGNLLSWYRVGIFSKSEIIDYSWITELLQSHHFRDHVSYVRHYGMRNDLVIYYGMCSFGILYFTKNKEQINEKYVIEPIQHYRRLLGKDNVIIVIDDVEDSSDQKKTQILESHPDIEDLYHNLFLFSPQEKSSEFRTLLSSLLNINKPPQPQAEKAGPVEGATGNDDIVTTDGAPNKDKTPKVSFKGNMDKIRKIVESTRPKKWRLFTKPHTVGIFSRSSESDYEWIIKQLKSESFRNIVSTAIPHSISNNGMRKFMDAVSRCTFAILYHTKNRGRINIVDVTNSLYDEELKYLSKHLGREKVIVVVDDLEDTSDGEKRRILETQPSIGTLARDIFLFNANDNKKR